MNRNDYIRAVILGVVLGMSSLTLVYMMNVALDTKDAETPKVQSNFEVVDHYKGCEVVRWSDHMMATYKYFMWCDE